jgi:hypothetical protein
LRVHCFRSACSSLLAAAAIAACSGGDDAAAPTPADGGASADGGGGVAPPLDASDGTAKPLAGVIDGAQTLLAFGKAERVTTDKGALLALSFYAAIDGSDPCVASAVPSVPSLRIHAKAAPGKSFPDDTGQLATFNGSRKTADAEVTIVSITNGVVEGALRASFDDQNRAAGTFRVAICGEGQLPDPLPDGGGDGGPSGDAGTDGATDAGRTLTLADYVGTYSATTGTVTNSSSNTFTAKQVRAAITKVSDTRYDVFGEFVFPSGFGSSNDSKIQYFSQRIEITGNEIRETCFSGTEQKRRVGQVSGSAFMIESSVDTSCRQQGNAFILTLKGSAFELRVSQSSSGSWFRGVAIVDKAR